MSRILSYRFSLTVMAAAIFGLAFSLSAVLASPDSLTDIEIGLFYAINGWSDMWSGLFTLITYAGSLGAVVVVGLLALWRRQRRASLTVLMSGALAWVVADVMKQLLGRARPGEFFSDAVIRYDLFNVNNGYPSGHAALAAAIAMSLALVVPRRWVWLLAIGAGLVGLSRIYLGVHLPLDVIGGWSVGIIVGFGVDLLLKTERREIDRDQKS